MNKENAAAGQTSAPGAGLPASVEPPFDQPHITAEDLVQKNFMKFPDSLIHQSKSLQNYAKLPRHDQSNLSKMRRAEQNATRRKEQVVRILEGEER